MDIIVPQVGESIVEAEIGEWLKQDGDYVDKDDLLVELETEKVNVEINADASGRLSIQAKNGETVKIGSVIGTIDENAQEDSGTAQGKGADSAEAKEPSKETSMEPPEEGSEKEPKEDQEAETNQKPSTAAPMNPAVPKMAAERDIDPATLQGSGRDGRILVDDIPAKDAEAAVETSATPADDSLKAPQQSSSKEQSSAQERVTRVPMTQIRKKIAAHLMKARQETAMLTTFNEIDMTRVIKLRRRHKENFQEKHGVGLGFMSFFVAASAAALKLSPEVNASIDDNDIVYHNYYDIGIAVSSKRGLVVPVIRDADQLSHAAIEKTVRDFAERAGAGKLNMDDLEGGTFSISNGGIFGSVLSTPLLNPPQSAILGMHAIQDRPVAKDGEVIIRPIMNVALSYDHRIIDGQQAVSFLKQVKTYVEEPETLLLGI